MCRYGQYLCLDPGQFQDTNQGLSMLVFAENSWQLLSATIVFLVGLFLALSLSRFFKIAPKHAVFLYLWHGAFCLFYFHYSLHNIADSTSYYTYSLEYDLGPALGTAGIYFLTSFFSAGLGLSYGGVFLVYNIIGFIGMLAFAGALQQIVAGAGRRGRWVAIAVVLLPGLSFWSVAIGKDALAFMAAGLSTWGALDLARRYPALIVAALSFLVARPHIAGIMLASIAFAQLFSSRISLVKKFFLTAILLPGAYFGVGFGIQYAGLGEAESIGDLTEYFEKRQGYNLDGGSSVDIFSMSIPMRLLTYLFRPFFFDLGGRLGLVVSFENLFLLAIILSSIFMIFRGRRTALNRFAWFFFLSFIIVSWFTLANSTANLGIAIRQKWMFLPMLLLLALSYCFRVKRR
jgi:hypothetical protein